MKRIRVTDVAFKHLRTCAAFVAALALLSNFATFANSKSETKAPAGVQSGVPNPASQVADAHQDGRAAQMYIGEGARLRAHQLRSANKAIGRAMRDLEKRGLTPRWDQSATIFQSKSISTASTLGNPIQRVSYPQTWTDGDYELTLITYSSGNSQWEGIVYLHNPYEDDAYEALISTPVSAEWDTVYEYWYPPDGGDPECGTDYCPRQGSQGWVHRGLNRDTKTRLANASYGFAVRTVRAPGIFGRIKQWVKCVWGHRDAIGWCPDLWCAIQLGWFIMKKC